MTLIKIDYVKVGKLLFKLRQERNMTQEELAQIIKVDKGAISQWERGGNIRTEHVYNLAKYFSIQPSELLKGKLDTETFDDVWRRVYDLSAYDFSYVDEDDEEDLERVKKYYECYSLINKRFFTLLPLWANDKLLESEQKEFLFLKKQYTFNTDYYNHFRKDVGEKKFVALVCQKYQNDSKESYWWELTKLYFSKIDLKKDFIFEIGGIESLEYMLSVMNQAEKDAILDRFFKCEFIDEIDEGFQYVSVPANEYLPAYEVELSPRNQAIMNAGCQLHYESEISETIDEEYLAYFEGEKQECELNPYEQSNYNFYNDFLEIEVDVDAPWYYLSYEQYQSLIDINRTEYYRDISKLKHTNPLEYFNNILKRDGINL